MTPVYDPRFYSSDDWNQMEQILFGEWTQEDLYEFVIDEMGMSEHLKTHSLVDKGTRCFST